MTLLSFQVHGVYTERLSSGGRVLSVLPGTITPVAVPTYAARLSPGQKVFVAINDPAEFVEDIFTSRLEQSLSNILTPQHSIDPLSCAQLAVASSRPWRTERMRCESTPCGLNPNSLGGSVMEGEIEGILKGGPTSSSIRICRPGGKSESCVTSSLPLDQLVRICTAFDRAISWILIAYAECEPAFGEIRERHAIHSGLLIRGVLPESYAIEVMLYPDQTVGATQHPEISEQLISITRGAFEAGRVGRLAAKTYGISEDALESTFQRVVQLQRQILPLVPLKVHKLANIREKIIKLDRVITQMNSHRSGGFYNEQRRLIQVRNADVRLHAQLIKILNRDFVVDCQKFFRVTDNLIDKIVLLFGNDFEVLRPILEHYTERNKPNKQIAADERVSLPSAAIEGTKTSTGDEDNVSGETHRA